jgi:hypothetical protein
MFEYKLKFSLTMIITVIVFYDDFLQNMTGDFAFLQLTKTSLSNSSKKTL